MRQIWSTLVYVLLEIIFQTPFITFIFFNIKTVFPEHMHKNSNDNQLFKKATWWLFSLFFLYFVIYCFSKYIISEIKLVKIYCSATAVYHTRKVYMVREPLSNSFDKLGFAKTVIFITYCIYTLNLYYTDIPRTHVNKTWGYNVFKFKIFVCTWCFKLQYESNRKQNGKLLIYNCPGGTVRDKT